MEDRRWSVEDRRSLRATVSGLVRVRTCGSEWMEGVLRRVEWTAGEERVGTY